MELVYTQVDKNRDDQVAHSAENHWHFTSQPYVRNEDASYAHVTDYNLKGLMQAENNFAGLEAQRQFRLGFIGHSARITRARLYYAISDTISYDLRSAAFH